MDFRAWQMVFFGCVTIILAIYAVVRPVGTPIRTRVIGSGGCLLLTVGFFVLARSHAVRAVGVWYHPYLASARHLREISLLPACTGATCLLWWVVAIAEPDRINARTRRSIIGWFAAGLVCFWAAAPCVLFYRHWNPLKYVGLGVGLAALASLSVGLAIYLVNWNRTRPPRVGETQ